MNTPSDIPELEEEGDATGSITLESELDSLLDTDNQPMSRTKLREWNAGVHSRIEDDLDSLLEEASRPRALWTTVAAVVLIHEQHCESCGNITRSCDGWFTSQNHVTDPFAHRLVAGRPIGRFPLRVERHIKPPVHICAFCVEERLAIEESNASNGGH